MRVPSSGRMSGMLDSVSSFFETTLGNMPLAVLTIALLATPTLIYVVYRLSVPSTNHGKARSAAPASAQWVCPRCRSVNDLMSGRCYHCDFRVDDAGDDLLVIDSVTAKPIVLPTPSVERPAIAVGPGPQPSAPAVAAPPPAVPFSMPSGPASPGVPVGPGGPGVPVGPAPAPRVVATPANGAPIASVVGARRPYDTVPAPGPVGAPIAPGAVVEPEPVMAAVGASAAASAASPSVAAAPVAAAPEAPVEIPAPAPEAPAPVEVPAPAAVSPVEPAVRPTPPPVRPAPRIIVATPLPDATAPPNEGSSAG